MTNNKAWEKYDIIKKENEYGLYTLYSTNIGEFLVMRKDNDVYGNPLYRIHPQGFVRQLPPIQGMRRNNWRQYYTTQSYDIDQTMVWFLERLDELSQKGISLYHNK